MKNTKKYENVCVHSACRVSVLDWKMSALSWFIAVFLWNVTWGVSTVSSRNVQKTSQKVETAETFPLVSKLERNVKKEWM